MWVNMLRKGAFLSRCSRSGWNIPFSRHHPPKTTGREVFGRQFANQVLEQARTYSVNPPDLVATLTAFTAQTIFDYYRRFLFPHYSVDEIYISGGGSHNLTLMQHLKMLFRPIPLLSADAIGVSSDAKEAIAFAVLANEAVHGRPTNLPQVTGASKTDGTWDLLSCMKSPLRQQRSQGFSPWSRNGRINSASL